MSDNEKGSSVTEPTKSRLEDSSSNPPPAPATGGSLLQQQTPFPKAATSSSSSSSPIVKDHKKAPVGSRSKRNSMRRRDVGVASPGEGGKPLRPPPGLTTPKTQLPPSMLLAKQPLKYTIDELLALQHVKTSNIKPPNLPAAIDKTIVERNHAFDERNHKNSWGNDDRYDSRDARPRRLFPERPDAGYQPSSTRDKDRDDRGDTHPRDARETLRDPRDNINMRGDVRDSPRFPERSSGDTPRFGDNTPRFGTDSPRYNADSPRFPDRTNGADRFGWRTPKANWRDRRRDELDRGRDDRDDYSNYRGGYRYAQQHTPRDDYYRESSSYRDGRDPRGGGDTESGEGGREGGREGRDSRDLGDFRDRELRRDSLGEMRGARDTPRGEPRESRGDPRDHRDTTAGDYREHSRYRRPAYNDDDRLHNFTSSPTRSPRARGPPPSRRYDRDDAGGGGAPSWFLEDFGDRPFSFSDSILDRESDQAHMDKYGFLPARGRRMEKPRRSSSDEDDERNNGNDAVEPSGNRSSETQQPDSESGSQTQTKLKTEADTTIPEITSTSKLKVGDEVVSVIGEKEGLSSSSSKTVDSVGAQLLTTNRKRMKELSKDPQPEPQPEPVSESQPVPEPEVEPVKPKLKLPKSLLEKVSEPKSSATDAAVDTNRVDTSKDDSAKLDAAKSESLQGDLRWSEKLNAFTEPPSNGTRFEVDSLFSKDSKRLDQYMKLHAADDETDKTVSSSPSTVDAQSSVSHSSSEAQSAFLSVETSSKTTASQSPPSSSATSVTVPVGSPPSSTRGKHRFGIKLEESPQNSPQQESMSAPGLRLDDPSSTGKRSQMSHSSSSGQPRSDSGSTQRRKTAPPPPIQTPQDVGFDDTPDFLRAAAQHNNGNLTNNGFKQRTTSRFGFPLDDSPPKHVENHIVAQEQQQYMKQLDTFSLDGARLAADQQRSRLQQQQQLQHHHQQQQQQQSMHLHHQQHQRAAIPNNPNGMMNNNFHAMDLNPAAAAAGGPGGYTLVANRGREPQASPREGTPRVGMQQHHGGMHSIVPAEMDLRMQQSLAGLHLNPSTLQQIQHHQQQQQQHHQQQRHSEADYGGQGAVRTPYEQQQQPLSVVTPSGGVVGGVGLSHAAQQAAQMNENELLFKYLDRCDLPPLPPLDHGGVVPSDYGGGGSQHTNQANVPPMQQGGGAAAGGVGGSLIPAVQQQRQQQQTHLQHQIDASQQLVYQQVMSQTAPPHIIHTQARTPRDATNAAPVYFVPPHQQYQPHNLNIAVNPSPMTAHHQQQPPQQPQQQQQTINTAQYHPPPNLPHPVYTASAPSPTAQSSYGPPLVGTALQLGPPERQQQQQQQQHLQDHHHQRQNDQLGRYLNRTATYQQEKVQNVPQMQNMQRTYLTEMDRKYGSLSAVQ